MSLKILKTKTNIKIKYIKMRFMYYKIQTIKICIKQNNIEIK